MDKPEEFCSGLLTSRGLRVSDVKDPEHRVLRLRMDKSQVFCSGLLTSRGLRVSDVKSAEHRVLRLRNRNSVMDKPEEFWSGLLTSQACASVTSKVPSIECCGSAIGILLWTNPKSSVRDF